MVAKRVISACARVTDLLEVLWGGFFSKVKPTSADWWCLRDCRERLIKGEQ